jgi:hypothetical protein
MAKSDNLRKAKEAKNDEFYTRLEDIKAEISSHPDYVRQFQNKIVFCNCDNPEWSSFYEFFRLHFNQLGLKKLITTHYNKDGSPSYKLEWSGEKLGDDTVNMIKTPLQGDGDFRSDECVELLKEADIVVTNPPFSLFREYIAQLEEYGKQYIVLGSTGAIAYKEIFPLLLEGKMFIGYMTGSKSFRVPDDFENSSTFYEDGVKYAKFGNIYWYTNLDLDKIHESLILTKNYTGNESKYPKYDNYDAIEVSSVKDIPKDYFEPMGVPITFLTDYCPDQFEILGLTSGRDEFDKRAWPTKRYEEPKQYLFKDGKWNESNGSKINTGAVLIYEDKPATATYYTANNQPLPLKRLYNRIIICRKKVS